MVTILIIFFTHLMIQGQAVIISKVKSLRQQQEIKETQTDLLECWALSFDRKGFQMKLKGSANTIIFYYLDN